MNVGREQQGGEAIGVVNLDSAPSPKALEAVGGPPRHPERQRHQAPGGRGAGVAGGLNPGSTVPFPEATRGDVDAL